jgi:hypothetical protein
MVKRLALHGSVFEKKAQTKHEEKRAQECIEILFEPKKQNTMDHSYVVNMVQE